MKQEDSGSGSSRRVSFLMPYIDFCFMLIIIFVGMLSIAYFDEPGKTDIQAKESPQIDNYSGEHETLPQGMQERRRGVGEVTPQGEVHPLRSPEQRLKYMNPVPDAKAPTGVVTPRPASSGAARPSRMGAARQPSVETGARAGEDTVDRQGVRGGADPEELQKLREEVEHLRQTQGTGPKGEQGAKGTGTNTQNSGQQPEPPQNPGNGETTSPGTGGESNNLYLDLRSNQ